MKAPIHYSPPLAPSGLPGYEAKNEDALLTDEIEAQALRSLRPGQQGFAERFMSKHGWTRGSGLGATGSGIINPLRVQLEKQKKQLDSDGVGLAFSGGKGKIVGGGRTHESSYSQETGKFGVMSEVVVLHGMVDGMDLDIEMEGAGDGGLIQEIGDECGEKVRASQIHFLIVKQLTAQVWPRREGIY